jgi:hypothetical protein
MTSEAVWWLMNGRTRASTKNGNQHNVKALMMIPNVVDACHIRHPENKRKLTEIPPDE